MSENLRICRRCLLTESGREDIMRDIEQRIAKLSPDEKSPAELYGGRLEICRQCDFLENGTCLKCGCYPQFRAACIKNKCPVKRW